MVGDDMFATEGDSVDVGRQSTATRENGRAGVSTSRSRPLPGLPSQPPSGGPPPGSPPGSASGPAVDDVGADVLHRLRDRVDRNLRLVDRMRADPLAPEPPGLADLIDTARRLRHDAETLLLLAGIDAGARPGAPVRLATLLDEAVDATEEPMRVDVRSGPAATIEPAAATELLHVVAEVVDHVTAIHPGGRIEVSSRTEAQGGIAVEVRTASTTRYDPSGRRGMAAASRMAQRSVSGLVLRSGPPGPAGSTAPIATIHCPAIAVRVQELDHPPMTLAGLDTRPEPWTPSPSPSPSLPASPSLPSSNGYRRVEQATPVRGLPVDPLFGELSVDPFGEPPSDPFSPAPRDRTDTDPFLAVIGGATNGRPHRAEPVDELFGPLVHLPAESEGSSMATPIFEAVASAWFHRDTASEQATDWESPSDREWRAAAERAAAPESTSFTAEGLPRRRPGGRLVAPRVRDGGGGAHAQSSAPTDRVPDRVRERLATYQRGLRQGRHRAEPSDPGDQAAW